MKRKALLMTLTLVSLLAFSLFGCGGGKTDTNENTATPTRHRQLQIRTVNRKPKTPATLPKAQIRPTRIGCQRTCRRTAAKNRRRWRKSREKAPQTARCRICLPSIRRPEAGLRDHCRIRCRTWHAEHRKAQVTDERDENNASNPEKVVVIDYAYTNSSDQALLLDSMSFKLVEGDTACTPYYAAFLKSPEPAEKGQSSSGQIAFEESADFTKGTLVFDSALAGEELSFEIEV